LLVPAIYRGIAAAFGRKATYRRLLAGYAYTWTIYLIPTLLTILIVMTRSEIDPNELNYARVLKSNLAAFLDFDTTSKPLLALLSSVDVFDIWGYIVGSIAVSKMTEFTRKGAMAVVGSVWGVYIVIKVCLGAFLGMMG
ncbi:MAG TPA: YIP1 family protein, partial [Candidatus Polarisedimenticolaceae bacterium]|nr:YIP1 family protein [Candidatus Polarisedimenticolaceae bacterium]